MSEQGEERLSFLGLLLDRLTVLTDVPRPDHAVPRLGSTATDMNLRSVEGWL